jgi:phosphate-selective porin OprO/OprP
MNSICRIVCPRGVLARIRGLELVFLAITALIFLIPQVSRGQSEAEAPQTIAATVDTTLEAGDADAEEPRRKLVKWNEYDGPISTLRIGMGFLLDFASYEQDSENEQQVTLDPPDVGVRDFRFLFKGRFKTKRPLSWTLGYMYDAAEKEWRFRQTGLQVDVPELSGRFFLGRTKEGYSLIKVMVGYHPWMGMERSPAEDAFVPILADGLKYMGYYKDPRIFFQLGAFADWLSENEKFSTFDHQIAWRLGWLPILSEEQKRVLHVAVMGREGQPDEKKIQVRSRPGAYFTPYFVDTGKFDADYARVTGVETYYRAGSWLFGAEYNWENVDDADAGNALFHAGDASVAWLITGETRAYNAPGAFFEGISPDRPVTENGPGAWEAILHVSYTDFDSGRFHGGKLWRLGPAVNWHLSDNLRTTFVYGYSVLDRFELEGGTHFFQMRLAILI